MSDANVASAEQVARLVRERDAARAEVERLRSERDEWMAETESMERENLMLTNEVVDMEREHAAKVEKLENEIANLTAAVIRGGAE